MLVLVFVNVVKYLLSLLCFYCNTCSCAVLHTSAFSYCFHFLSMVSDGPPARPFLMRFQWTAEGSTEGQMCLSGPVSGLFWNIFRFLQKMTLKNFSFVVDTFFRPATHSSVLHLSSVHRFSLRIHSTPH